ncbi:MAG: hypothetical protein KJO09_05430 [Gammaproteobacteria bacterium]|nr:hypothetical protein [Gammaproteobacteria bacterium]
MAGSLIQELKRRNVFRVAAIYVVVSWLLMQIADVMFPALLLPEWAPTLLVAFLILGFPIALIFAWAFEMTPEGVVRTADVPEGQSITAETGYRLNYTIIGVLALAVVLLLLKDVFFDDAPQPALPADIDKSIAVLPFKNQSAAAENAEFFAGGLHDELLTLLSRLGELRVISRTSVERLDPILSIPEIGEMLGVATVLEGQVQRAGDRLRINVQLIDTADEGHIWANTYDSELTAANVFDVQSDIAQTIVGALHAQLSPDEKQLLEVVPTQNTKALQNYLIGGQLSNRHSYASLEEASTYLEKAIELDPTYTLAMVRLADIFFNQYSTGAISSEIYLQQAEPIIARLLQLDPGLPGANTQLAMLRWAQDDPEAAEVAFKETLRLHPGDSRSLEKYGTFLRFEGRLDEAETMLTRALLTDPLSTKVLFELGKVEMYQGYPEKFLQRARRIAELDPESAHSTTALIQAHLWMGRFDRMWASYLSAFELDPNDHETWAHIAVHLEDVGLPELADRYLDRALALAPEAPVTLKCQALVLLSRGEVDKAFEISSAALHAGLDDRWGSLQVFLRIVRDQGLASGELDESLRFYRTMVPGLFVKEPTIDASGIAIAADLALLLQAAGEDTQAASLLDNALAWYAENQPDGVWGFLYNIVDIELLAVASRNEEALQRLRAAVDYGWRANWPFYTYNRNLQSIAGDVEFQRQLAVLSEDMEQQRAVIQALPHMGEYDLRDK